MRFSTEDMALAINPYEDKALENCDWFVGSYRISNGQVYCCGKAHSVYHPADDADLFLSFARLGARGMPSETSILRWVSKYGLLRNKPGEITPGGAPMKIDDFRREVLCAYQMLDLYRAIEIHDYSALDHLIFEHRRHPKSDWPATPRTVFDAYLLASDNRWVTTDCLWREYNYLHDKSEVTDEDLMSHFLLSEAWKLLQFTVEYSLRDVKPSFAKSYDWKKYPVDERHRLAFRKGWRCENLIDVIYLQFFHYATREKPLRLCENPACGLPFPTTRKDKRFCNPTCRSNARNYR